MAKTKKAATPTTPKSTAPDTPVPATPAPAPADAPVVQGSKTTQGSKVNTSVAPVAGQMDYPVDPPSNKGFDDGSTTRNGVKVTAADDNDATTVTSAGYINGTAVANDGDPLTPIPDSVTALVDEGSMDPYERQHAANAGLKDRRPVI